MQNITEIEKFLKLISEISKNGISIDSNLVYSNLISIYNKKESTIEYFDSWQKNFEKVGNMSVFVDLNWKHFCQFKSYSNKEKVCICVAQAIPTVTSANTVAITIIFQRLSKASKILLISILFSIFPPFT